MAPAPQEARAAFLRTFKDIARHKHRFEVWRDFVTLAACALHNSVNKFETQENEYLAIINSYEADDRDQLCQLLGHLVTMLDEEPKDILGPLYLELEIGEKDKGQYFTPAPLSEMMARLTFGDVLSHLDTKPFITLQEPACGAGGMVLALVKVLIQVGHDPATRIWVQCIDVDRTAALMCFVQLTLWNVPAQIVVGNTLTLETRETWCTPQHYLGFWDAKLKARKAADHVEMPSPPAPPEEEPPQPDRSEPEFVEHEIDWRAQVLTVRYCASWMGQDTAHLEILSPDRKPHPISETGYRSHFLNAQVFEEAGGPVAYTLSWLAAVDDGKPKQMSLFDDL